MTEAGAPSMPQTCACHGRPWPECPMFGPLYQEEVKAPKAGSGPAIPPSAAKEKGMPKAKDPAPEKGAKRQPVHRHEEEREVRVAIEDPAKREEILQSMLRHMKDETDLTNEAKEVAVGYRKRLKDLAKTIDSESLELKQGMPVNRLCEITRNFNATAKYPNGRLTVKDKETGAIYEDRELTDADAQLPISDLPNAQDEEAEGAGDDGEEA